MITQATKLKIKNKTITMEEFMAKYAITDMETAISTAEVLVKQGKISIAQGTLGNDLAEDIAKAIEKEEIHGVVGAINAEERAYKESIRNAKAEESDLVSIGLAFPTTMEAMKAEQWINSLGINDTEVSIKGGRIVLKVTNITPPEYTKIARKYQIEKTLKNGVELTGKALENLTGAVNYTATEVIAPVAKLAGEAGMNLGKGLLQTGVKVGAGLVNSGAKAIEDTKIAMSTDAEMLRAQEQLKNAKDTVSRFFRKKFDKSASKSGIEIL